MMESLKAIIKYQGAFPVLGLLILPVVVTGCELGHPKDLSLQVSYAMTQELYQERRYEEMLRSAQETLRLAEKLFGPNDPKTAFALNTVALAYEAQNRYGEAEPLYKKAITLQEQGMGSGDDDLGRYMINLAGMYQTQGRYTEAATYYQRGLAIWQRTRKPDDRESVAVQKRYQSMPQ